MGSSWQRAGRFWEKPRQMPLSCLTCQGKSSFFGSPLLNSGNIQSFALPWGAGALQAAGMCLNSGCFHPPHTRHSSEPPDSVFSVLHGLRSLGTTLVLYTKSLLCLLLLLSEWAGPQDSQIIRQKPPAQVSEEDGKQFLCHFCKFYPFEVPQQPHAQHSNLQAHRAALEESYQPLLGVEKPTQLQVRSTSPACSPIWPHWMRNAS